MILLLASLALADDAVRVEEPMEASPPGVPGPKRYGFDFRRRNHTGIGLTVGTDAIGVVLKTMLTDHAGLQVSFGASFGTWPYWARSGGYVAIDYLQHPPTLFETPHVALAWDIGVGVSARAAGRVYDLEAAMGLSAVAGLELLLEDLPIDVTLSYRPGVLLTFTRPVGLTFAFGDVNAQVRWWF